MYRIDTSKGYSLVLLGQIDHAGIPQGTQESLVSKRFGHSLAARSCKIISYSGLKVVR